MDENRFNRLEERVDSVKDDIAEIKAKQSVSHTILCDLREDFHSHVEEIKDHIAGDKKIINHIDPLLSILPTLSEIVQKYHYEKTKAEEDAEVKRNRNEAWKNTSVKVGVIGSILSAILYVASKLGL